MKNSNLLVVSFLLFTTASIAQVAGESKPKLEMKRNHIQFEAGTGSGKIEDMQLSNAKIKYSSSSVRLGYEHHLKNDFRFQLYLSNEASKLKQKSEGLNAPYVAFESRLGFLAPVAKKKDGINMYVGTGYAFSTRFTNWEKRNLMEGNFSSLTAHHFNAAVMFEYQKNRWHTSLGLNMPILAYVYRSSDPEIIIEDGEFSPLFENGTGVTPKNYKVPDARFTLGYRLTNFLELNLNYNFKQINSSLGANIKQVEQQVRLGIKFNL